jgi:ABC-2 type transport system ATP-binding protein
MSPFDRLGDRRDRVTRDARWLLLMITGRSLTKQFGNILAVDGLNFEIAAGRVVGLLGPNGAGKTTLIRMITGYLPPTTGAVTVDSLPVMKHVRAIRRRIGYLPESTPLYSEMRVGEFLRFRARLFGMPRSRRRTAIDFVLRRCWLTDVRRRPIHQLSKGFRQRVGLAAALLHDPAVLILDEPTVGLDPAQIREVRALIRELAGRHTVLLSSHILAEVELTCDQIMIMMSGRIGANGSVDELKAQATLTARYVIETDSDKASEILTAVGGVKAVEPTKLNDSWSRLVVTSDDAQADLREPIARALSAERINVRELQRQAPSLEHLFVELMEQEREPTESRRAANAGGAT